MAIYLGEWKYGGRGEQHESIDRNGGGEEALEANELEEIDGIAVDERCANHLLGGSGEQL